MLGGEIAYTNFPDGEAPEGSRGSRLIARIGESGEEPGNRGTARSCFAPVIEWESASGR